MPFTGVSAMDRKQELAQAEGANRRELRRQVAAEMAAFDAAVVKLNL